MRDLLVRPRQASQPDEVELGSLQYGIPLNSGIQRSFYDCPPMHRANVLNFDVSQESSVYFSRKRWCSAEYETAPKSQDIPIYHT